MSVVRFLMFIVTNVQNTFVSLSSVLSSYFLLSFDERTTTFMLSFYYRGNNEESADESKITFEIHI